LNLLFFFTTSNYTALLLIPASLSEEPLCVLMEFTKLRCVCRKYRDVRSAMLHNKWNDLHVMELCLVAMC